MNDVKHLKTGRWSVEAFKQAARDLTMPVGCWVDMPGEDRLLAILNPRLPLVDFDPLAAGPMDDKAAAYAGRIAEEDSALTVGQGTGKDSGPRAAAAGHSSDRAANQAHRSAGHVPSTPAAAWPSRTPLAAHRERARPPAIHRVKVSDPASGETFSPAPMPEVAATGLTGAGGQAISSRPRLNDSGGANGVEPGNDAGRGRHGQSVDPLGPVVGKLDALADALLGPGGGVDKTASGKAHPWPFRQLDDRGPTAPSSDRQVPRAPGRLRQQPGSGPPVDHRDQRRADAPISQASKPKKALGKTEHQGEFSPKGRGGGNHHRSLEEISAEKISGRRCIATIDLVNALTDQCGQLVTAVFPSPQPEGNAIQTGPLTNGGQANPTSLASEMPPARPAAHATRPLSSISMLAPPDDHMAAERLVDMINDVLVAQARRHGVDLS